MKKILMLGDINSPHFQKWVSGVASLGYVTSIFSMSASKEDWYTESGIRLIGEKKNLDRAQFSQSDISKIKYFNFRNSVKLAIDEFSPDIIHAHYATSYGMLAAHTKFHPYILSTWGTDVFDFPKRSIIHRYLLKRNFRKADLILSTSNVLKDEIMKYTEKAVRVIPFGIDTDIFFPAPKTNDDKTFVIGIVKSLETVYGIEFLIKAFKIIIDKYPGKKLRLVIAGDGSLKQNFEKQIHDLNLSDTVSLIGRVSQNRVPELLNQFDLFVCPSLHESFGVSVLEASACKKPVIVSDVGGLREVAVKGITGLFVKPWDVSGIANAISYFIDNQEMISVFGEKGRKFVEEKFSWKNNLREIDDIYKQF